MPGRVVDFWTWQKEKAAGKAASCLENIYLHFIRSNEMLAYVVTYNYLL